MKKNRNYIFRFSILFQILIIAFATGGAVAAEEQNIPVPEEPEFPLLLSGDLYVNGAKAPIGTIIDVKLNDKSLCSTVVKVEGKFGDDYGNKLLIECAPEEYSNLVFELNSKKLTMNPIDVDKADSDGFLTLTIDADVSGNNVEVTYPKKSGGGGFLISDETKSEIEGKDQGKGLINDVGAKDLLKSEGTDNTSGAYAEQMPESEKSSNKGLIIAVVGVIGLLLVGILVSRSRIAKE